jgi:predicted dehydrogenase
MITSMKKIAVAVVGVGHLGRRHALAYKELENAELVAVCDTNPEKLAQACRETDVSGYQNYQELFPRVQAVSIAVPTQLHYQISHDFLSQNIHVLVEKPFTNTLKEADRLIKLSEKKDLILQVGHIERFNSAFSAVKEIIREPGFIECHRLSPFPGRSLDIGVVLDLMIHDIDIILGLVKTKVKKIEAVGVNILTDYEDIANARITFKNGCICNLTASRVSEEIVRKIRIFLENSYISLDYKNEVAFIYKKTALAINKEKLPIEKEEPLKKELASFLDCVLTHRPPVVDGRTAREALAVALAIQKKIWQGKRF